MTVAEAYELLAPWRVRGEALYELVTAEDRVSAEFAEVGIEFYRRECGGCHPTNAQHYFFDALSYNHGWLGDFSEGEYTWFVSPPALRVWNECEDIPALLEQVKLVQKFQEKVNGN